MKVQFVDKSYGVTYSVNCEIVCPEFCQSYVGWLLISHQGIYFDVNGTADMDTCLDL